MHDYDLQTQTEFKSTQEIHLATGDGLVEEKMARLEAALDKTEKRLKQMSVLESRTQFEGEGESSSGHGQAFMSYIRKGLDMPLQAYEAKSLSTTSEEDGGYLVPSGLQERLYATLQATSVMRSLASVRSISTSVLELLIDKDEADAGWIAETADRVETETPELSKVRIPVHEMYAKPRATQKLLDDAFLNVEEWLAQKISQKMAAMENAAFLMGDGNNKPKGILAYDTSVRAEWEWGEWEEIKTGANGGFVEDLGGLSLQDLFFSLKPQYLPGSSWLMSRSAQAAIRKLTDEDGRFLWELPLGGSLHPTLLGYPVVICDDVPSLVKGTASKSVLFGNFKEAYQIVDRTGTRILRDPYSSKPYVEFYTTRRLGGAALNFEALKVLNFAA